MNHLDTISLLIQKLERNGYTNEATIITREQAACAAGSELLMRIGFALNRMAEKQPAAYKTIQNEARQLIGYCHSIGLFPQ